MKSYCLLIYNDFCAEVQPVISRRRVPCLCAVYADPDGHTSPTTFPRQAKRGPGQQTYDNSVMDNKTYDNWALDNDIYDNWALDNKLMIIGPWTTNL